MIVKTKKLYCTNILKTTISKSIKKRYRLRSAPCTTSASGSGNATWVNISTVFRTPRLNTTTHQHKYIKLFKSFAQRKANNSKHGHSQSQIFTDANMLITSPAWYVVTCSLWRPNILPLFNQGW